MLQKIFNHCILYKYCNEIHVDCYDSFNDAMKKLEEINMKYYPIHHYNHIKYISIFKYWPQTINKYFYNRVFDVDYKVIKDN